MSRAPIISGIRKLPKEPSRIGIATKKTMIVPWLVTRTLKVSGPTKPNPGTSVSGHASCQRIA